MQTVSIQLSPSNVSRNISPTDAMYAGNQSHYFQVGMSALTNIKHAVAIADVQPRSILDFGCGAGRVTRWLRAEFSEAAIEGCDIRDADILFVAEEFSARTWLSSVNENELKAPSTYDLIWVGSVFTHLSKPESIALFDTLLSWLVPKGLLVFTSHGRHAANTGPASYGVDEHWQNILSDFHENEFGYAAYKDTPRYGISLSQLQWWTRLITSRSVARLISMTEQSWDAHQDVISVQRL